jgi:hypothetical protein
VERFLFRPEGILWKADSGNVETSYEFVLLAVAREPKSGQKRTENPNRQRGLLPRVPMAGRGRAGPAVMGPIGAAARAAGAATAPARIWETAQENPAVDLYLVRDDQRIRLTLLHGVTRFESLGRAMQPTFRGNVSHLLGTLKKRYRALVEDRRLVNIDYREQVVSGVALRTLLGGISPGLKSAPLFDLASRLALLCYLRP